MSALKDAKENASTSTASGTPFPVPCPPWVPGQEYPFTVTYGSRSSLTSYSKTALMPLSTPLDRTRHLPAPESTHPAAASRPWSGSGRAGVLAGLSAISV
jgi:hypothetical protein